MSDFGSGLAAEIVANSQRNAAAIGELLSQACERTLQLVAGEPATLDLAALPGYLQGPGIVLVLQIDAERAALLLLPPAPDVFPAWSGKLDPESAEKLKQLGTQLAAALLPSELAPASCTVAAVADLAEALLRGQAPPDATVLPLTVSADDSDAMISLVWPAGNAGAVLNETAEQVAQDTPAAAETATATDPGDAAENGIGDDNIGSPVGPAQPRAAMPIKPRDFDESIDELPSYTRSLLKIEVPIIVTLANAKQSLTRILTLVPGTLLQFDKSCEEPLTLEIGEEQVAIGEAVKIGDKFGFRVTAMTMPREKLVPMKGRDKKV